MSYSRSSNGAATGESINHVGEFHGGHQFGKLEITSHLSEVVLQDGLAFILLTVQASMPNAWHSFLVVLLH
jgi:hypothetical protein